MTPRTSSRIPRLIIEPFSRGSYALAVRAGEPEDLPHRERLAHVMVPAAEEPERSVLQDAGTQDAPVDRHAPAADRDAVLLVPPGDPPCRLVQLGLFLRRVPVLRC